MAYRHHNATAALRRLIKQDKSLTEFARRLDVSRQTIYLWLEHGVPAERVPWLVSRLRGTHTVSKHELRPDLWNEREG